MPALPPAVVVHSLEQARAVLACRRPVTLLSAPAAGVFAGPGWWRAMIRACETEQPDLLDCADAAGRALQAVALGCPRIVLRPCPAWDSVAERAGAAGAVLLSERPDSLDWADRTAPRRIAAWLGVG